jgi:hypothetical protein
MESDPIIRFDHLVVAASSLDEGAAWVEARLGVAMSAVGVHEAMGTHNRLVSLGPGRFLEVIAIDPDGRPPPRPRWFELDTPAMHRRLARSPALIHWVVRTDDIARAIESTGSAACDVLSLSRGNFRWRIGVPPSGALSRDGIAPTIIQWDGGGHPSDFLPDAGCRLDALELHHPEASAILRALRLAGLDPRDPVEACGDGPRLVARIRTPRGIVTLAE